MTCLARKWQAGLKLRWLVSCIPHHRLLTHVHKTKTINMIMNTENFLIWQYSFKIMLILSTNVNSIFAFFIKHYWCCILTWHEYEIWNIQSFLPVLALYHCGRNKLWTFVISFFKSTFGFYPADFQSEQWVLYFWSIQNLHKNQKGQKI
jgi:hypothetical protein